MTEHLALVLCLQLAQDYHELLDRFGIEGQLTPENCRSIQSTIEDPEVEHLTELIVQNYVHNVTFLQEQKYG